MCIYWVDDTDIVDTAGLKLGESIQKTLSIGCYGDTWRPNNPVKLHNAPVLKSELQEERTNTRHCALAAVTNNQGAL